MAPKGRKGKSGTKKIPTSGAISSAPSSPQDWDNSTKPMDNRKPLGLHNKIPIQPVYSLNDMRKHLGFLEDASDLLFDFRFESFIQNNWPFSEPEGDLCNPKELALAGFSFIKNGDNLSARCVACAHIITDLEKHSDPWKLHTEKNPSCIIIKKGKPNSPDAYTMKQMMDIFSEAHIALLERSFKEMRNNVARRMLSLNEPEDWNEFF